MLTMTLFTAGALLSVVAAVPMQQNKRDVVWETKVEDVYVTVDVTTTMWLNPGETPPVAPAANAPPHYGHKHHGKNHHPQPKPETTTSAAPAPSSPAENSPSTYVAPTTSAAPPAESSPVATTPTSTYVAPATTAPASTAPAYSAPAPSPSSSPSGGGGGSGQTYTGDLTYYAPGLGSCGETSTSTEMIVALAEGMMTAAQVGGNPNDNPLCGKSITISYGGVSAVATIVDTCPGCSGGSLDLTPSLFQKFAPLGEGRLTGMTWQYN